MANTIKIKRGSGSDPSASDMVLGEPVLRTDTAELFFKKDDGSVAKVSGGGGGPDFKYLALRNAANNGAASFPNADFTLVTSGTTTAITPAAANTLLVSVNGVIQKPNTGTSTPSQGFALSGSTIKFGANISAAPDFILYQESGGIGEPSDETVSEEKLKVSNSPVNGYFLSAQSGNTGGLTWAAPVATSCTGNSATATALATARTINGTSFDGTSNITVTAAAGTLTGTTLNSSVVTSSLTSLGDLAGLTVNGDMSLTGANYNVLWDKSDNALEFADNAKAIFGTGNDLQIYHDGSNSYISEAGTGDLIIESSHIVFKDGGTQVFETTNTGARLLDDAKLLFGTGNDLEIFHNGSNSFIKDTGTGNLVISSNQVSLESSNLAEFMVKAIENAQVELYYNGSKKFETTSAGASVTGNLSVANHITLPDQASGQGKIKMGDGVDFQLYHNGTDSFIENRTGNLIFYINTNELAARFIPNGAVELYHDNSKKFETTSTGSKMQGTGDVSLNIGSTNAGGATINLDGDSNGDFTGNDYATIRHSTDGHLILHTKNPAGASNVYIQMGTSGHYGAMFKEGAESLLRYNNSTKIETTNTGVTITGRLNMTEGIDIPDGGDNNTSLSIGNGNDLRLYHDGSNSYIKDRGTGYLKVVASVFQVRNAADTETMIEAHDNGQVELYHNDTKVLNTANGGVQITDNLYITDGNSGQTTDGGLRIGDSGDLKIYHNGTNSYVRNSTGQLLVGGSGGDLLLEALGDVRTVTWEGENMIYARRNGSVDLYFNNSKKFETTANGVTITGSVVCDGLTVSDNEVIALGNSSDLKLYHDSGNNYVGSPNNQSLVFFTNNSSRWLINGSGHFLPIANNAYDIGSTSNRIRNLYTNDLNLSNEGGSNDVDGTWGSYTIQEGAEDLFLVNKRNGKKYKFNLTEVS